MEESRRGRVREEEDEGMNGWKTKGAERIGRDRERGGEGERE